MVPGAQKADNDSASIISNNKKNKTRKQTPLVLTRLCACSEKTKFKIWKERYYVYLDQRGNEMMSYSP